MEYQIRPYHPSDLTVLYRICLLTGDNGADASHLYQDPDLFGHYYAAPYAVFEPNLCFVLTDVGTPCGYILGTRDTIAFHRRCEKDWFPWLRERYPMPDPDDSSPDAQMIRSIHKGFSMDKALSHYPAHLHIDLLPAAQGQGWGRKLVEAFLNKLMALDVQAVHLQVSRRNPRAVRFYERLGFHRIKEYHTGIAYGMRLE
jgi:ribosomal protein S18 acetylase RimI-like enzyme